MRQRTVLLVLAGVLCLTTPAKRIEKELLAWEFSFDKKSWTSVQIPHDWAISGPFDKKWDLQVVRIDQNGETKATEKSGRTGALPWIGEGHYRTIVRIPKVCGHAMLFFDGAMAEPVVYVNGTKVGYWPNGYNAFRLDITSFLKLGDNLIEVDLTNVEKSSRWYPGAGLYRPVKLILTDRTFLDPWATSISTLQLEEDKNRHGKSEQKATIGYSTVISDVEGEVTCAIDIVDAKGRVVADRHLNVPADGDVHTTFQLRNPHLWSPESPYLYKVRTRLFRNNEEIDEHISRLGVRTVSVSKERGFQLNGQTRKIQGVCLHHDLGPLGAAVNKAALVRQIHLMKEMGCDAIRTAHNMPSTLQMDVCDSLGMMVMAESFDMWIYPKCENGYSRFFRDWAEKDITNLVLNHRNHPSIVMWSIGNEVPEQGDSIEGVSWARRLQDLCHSLDATRPVTQGMDQVEKALQSGFADVMDIVGLNYRTPFYDKALRKTSKGVILGSETASSLSSRGVYKLPYEVKAMPQYDDGQCSSYDNEYCYWSNLPDVDFENMDDLPYTIGQFVWTGIDYLGEPTPYDKYWPSRSSYFGICDLAGLPKDRYYLYRSVWNKQEHTLHIAPHWSWGKEYIGRNIPIQVYTDYDEAELFINGKSQGRIKKHVPVDFSKVGKTTYIPDLDRYRLRWMNVVYEPGEVKVVAYDSSGKPAMEKIIRTAGTPARLHLAADRTNIAADGKDLVYVTVTMMDSKGNPCPLADDLLEFSVEGEGQFKCVCNGDATSLESFAIPRMHLFNGQLVVTMQSSQTPGTLKLHVTCPSDNAGKAEGVRPEITSSITIKTK